MDPPQQQPDKQPRLDGDLVAAAARAIVPMKELDNLAGFTLSRVMGEDRAEKRLLLEGKFPEHSSSTAVLVLEKSHFAHGDLKELLSAKTAVLMRTRKSDVECEYELMLNPDLNTATATLIYPATGEVIVCVLR
jgi:hypothetical protein